MQPRIFPVTIFENDSEKYKISFSHHQNTTYFQKLTLLYMSQSFDYVLKDLILKIDRSGSSGQRVQKFERQWRSQDFSTREGGGGGKALKGGKVGRFLENSCIKRTFFCTLNLFAGYRGIQGKLCMLALIGPIPYLFLSFFLLFSLLSDQQGAHDPLCHPISYASVPSQIFVDMRIDGKHKISNSIYVILDIYYY